MKYLLTTIEFFRRYWPEVRHAAGLTVLLWTTVGQLAFKLAAELRQAESVPAPEPEVEIAEE